MKKKSQKKDHFLYLCIAATFGALVLMLVYLGMGLSVGNSFLANDLKQKCSFASFQPVEQTPVEIVDYETSITLEEIAADEEGQQLSVVAVSQADTEKSALSTQVYPGYTMTFDIVATSRDEIKTDQVPIFIYTIFDSNGKEILRVSEERIIQGRTEFSKRITLPRELEEGRYKLRIESFVDGQNYTEERYFLVQTSPIIALKGDLTNGISGFVSGLGWIAIILVLVVFALGIFAIIEYKIHHRGRVVGG